MKKFEPVFLGFLLTLIFSFQVMAAPYVTYKLTYDNKTVTYTEEAVYLEINGERLDNLPMPPVIMDGNALVPAREVFEKLGARVAWKDKEQEVDVLYNNIFVVMHINNKNAVVAGRNMEMSVAPKIINNKTMIPLRFVSEAVGLDVGWDTATRTASVNEPSTETTTETTTQAPPVITETTTQATEATTEAAEKFEIISTGLNNKSTITGISVPTGNSSSFVISGSSALSDVKVYELKDGKLTLDILNAENMLSSNSYGVTHPYVSAITASKYNNGTEPLTRIVFSVSSSARYSVDFSDDKTSVVVTFEQNEISDISLSQDNGNDSVVITGKDTPVISVLPSSDGSRLLIDLPYSKLNIDEKTLNGGNYIESVSYAQASLTTVRVTVVLKSSEYSYKTSASGNSVSIIVGENIVTDTSSSDAFITKEIDYSKLSAGYNSESRILAFPKNGVNVDISSVKHNDNYIGKSYELTFSANYSSVFGSGTVSIGDGYINSYSVTTTNGATTIKFDENKILTFDIAQDNNFVYIRALLPKEKYKNVVVLDAGHGGTDVGAVANGLYEKDINLDIVNKLVDLFNQDDEIKVYATRTTDVYPEFRDRTNLADEVGDIFISVHINSGGSATSANGTEVYHYNGKSTASGLSSNILANKMQEKLLSYLGSTDRKVKTGDLFVIRETYVPAVLCEIGFITNQQEAEKLGTDEYRMKAAQAIYDGCKELFEIYPNR